MPNILWCEQLLQRKITKVKTSDNGDNDTGVSDKLSAGTRGSQPDARGSHRVAQSATGGAAAAGAAAEGADFVRLAG